VGWGWVLAAVLLCAWLCNAGRKCLCSSCMRCNKRRDVELPAVSLHLTLSCFTACLLFADHYAASGRLWADLVRNDDSRGSSSCSSSIGSGSSCSNYLQFKR
jgi:hypothetical protein